MGAFAMSVQGFHEQKRWGTRTFGEGTQTDSESEEDDMEVSCVRGACVIGAGLWLASLGLAFNPIDHHLVIRYGSCWT